jgi:steroid 5-alpha reductase family enzyme
MIARILIVNAGLLLVYMTLWWLVARVAKRIDAVDTAWGLGFVVVAWSAALQQSSGRNWLVAGLVSIWGVRLAVHIGRRSMKRGSEDPRYAELGRKWHGNYWLQAYFRIFLLQGVLIWFISLPVVLATGSPIGRLGWLGTAGAIIWLIGFIVEAFADRQLANFINQPDHPKVLQTGLWRYSRHPNYFGEITQWWGIGIIALQVRAGWLGLLGPLLLTYLIIFISGIPPIEKRRQKDADYRAYQLRTSPLIPLPPRRPA